MSRVIYCKLQFPVPVGPATVLRWRSSASIFTGDLFRRFINNIFKRDDMFPAIAKIVRINYFIAFIAKILT